jgi:hypothetical protein
MKAVSSRRRAMPDAGNWLATPVLFRDAFWHDSSDRAMSFMVSRVARKGCGRLVQYLTIYIWLVKIRRHAIDVLIWQSDRTSPVATRDTRSSAESGGSAGLLWCQRGSCGGWRVHGRSTASRWRSGTGGWAAGHAGRQSPGACGPFASPWQVSGAVAGERVATQRFEAARVKPGGWRDRQERSRRVGLGRGSVAGW